MQHPKFLLLLGPSGVGKSTLIHYLQEKDLRFVYVSPYVTRHLREGELDKISIGDQEMDERAARGDFLVINSFFGIRYATPVEPIEKALNAGQFPILDWPVSSMDVMLANFLGRLFVVYVSPPSLEVLQSRLAKDGRDSDGQRYRAAEKELGRYWRGQYDMFCHLKIISHEGKNSETSKHIYQEYLVDMQKEVS